MNCILLGGFKNIIGKYIQTKALDVPRDRKIWMNKATDPVLELLAEGLVLNTQGIYFTLVERASSPDDVPGSSTIYRSLGELEDHGLIEPLAENHSYYRITKKGRRYLSGEPIDSE